MKKIMMITAALSLLAVFAFAGTDVPVPVKTKFATLYPKAEKPKWSKEGENYEANFEDNEVEMSIVFNATGDVLETETELSVSQLPQSVTDYCTKTFPGKKIKEAAKLVDSKGVVTYEAEIGGADQIFDSNGNFIKSAKE